jgi:hypothetical protein
MQERGYAASWGEEGARFIRREWGTAQDHVIEQQFQTAYSRGEFDLNDLGWKRALAERMIGDLTAPLSRCRDALHAP